MSNAIHPSIANVAADLTTAEISTDTQIAASANLMLTILRERAAAGLPYGATQHAMTDASEAMNLQLKSRHLLARAHERLRRTAIEHELVPSNYGDVFPWCDGEGGTLVEPKPAPLRVVGD